MKISGTSIEFPLPALLQILEQCQATGCLSLSISSPYYAELMPQRYDVWLSIGHAVSVQHQPYDPDIYALAVTRTWISGYAARKLKALAPPTIAAGLYLESQGALNADQLRSLFFSEVVHRLESLCSIPTAEFEFQSNGDLPMNYMTGLAIAPATISTNCIGSVKSWPLTGQKSRQDRKNNTNFNTVTDGCRTYHLPRQSFHSCNSLVD